MAFNPADSFYEQQISAPAITSAILQDGVVLGYGAYLDNNNDTLVANALEFMLESFTVGNILLQGADNSGLWYRYVTIPGHVLTTKGLTPMQAIECATKTNAELLGIEETTGTLTVGKNADLIVLDGNPLDDIHNTRKILAIWHGGREVQPIEPGK